VKKAAALASAPLSSAEFGDRWREWLERPGVPEFLLAALTLLVYARSLTLGFVYDDHVMFNSPWAFHLRDIPQLFVHDIGDHASNFYRPLAVLWHALVYKLAGTSPVAWHFSGIVLHIVCVLLVFRLTCRLLENRLLAAFATAVFALHPTHVEAVSWISDAGDPLMTALLLGSAVTLLRWFETGSPAWWMVSFLLGSACCFVKETGVLMPAMLLVLALSVEHKIGQPAIVLTGAVFLASSCAFVILRSHIIHGFAHPLSSAGNREWVLTVPAALWFYLSHLLAPVRLGPVYPVSFVSDWRSQAFLVPVLLLAIAAVAVLGIYFRSSDRRLVWFCCVWALTPLVAPLYLKLFPEFELVHDRYLYIPSIALGVALAAALKKLTSFPGTRIYLLSATAILLIALATATISYEGVWQSDLTLFQRAIEFTPRNPRALVNLGVAKLRQDNYPEGVALLKRALEIQPDNAFALFDLGNAAWENNDAATAEAYFEKAVALESRFKWWVFLAKARFKLAKLPQAESAVRQALAVDSAGLEAHALFGAIRLAQGDPVTAVREFRTELQLNPGDIVARELLPLAEAQLTLRPR
jgi:tetratricopeptide (TPR) repeat protein